MRTLRFQRYDRAVKPSPALLLFLGFLLAAAPAALGRPRTDVIALKNGDRITGEIWTMQLGLLKFKTDDMGTLSVEWERIVRISSEWPYILEDRNGERWAGAIHETPEPGRCMVLTESGPVTLELVNIVAIARYGKKVNQRFQGYLDFSFTRQKTNKDTVVNLATDISYQAKKWGVVTTGSSYVSRQENVAPTIKNLVTVDYLRYFRNKWNAGAFAQLEENGELNLDLRVLAGGGIGRYFFRTNRHVMSWLAGFDFSRENYVDETSSKSSLEAALGVSYQAFRYFFPNMSVSSSFYAYPSLTTSGRVRLKFQATIRYELFRRFYASLGFSDSYDSKPGGETTTKNDYSLNFGISWSLN